MVFDIKAYEKIAVAIDQEVLNQMSADFDPAGFYNIMIEGDHRGYFYFGKAPSKADDGIDRETTLKYGKDIIGISGATISAVSMCKEVNDLLKDLSKLPL